MKKSLCLAVCIFGISLIGHAKDVVKSDFDQRQYAYQQLENQVEIVVVSDPKAQQSTAALVVHSGSFKDPDAFPGLAHYVEHMVFFGQSKIS